MFYAPLLAWLAALTPSVQESAATPKYPLGFGLSACLVPDLDGDHVVDIAVGAALLEMPLDRFGGPTKKLGARALAPQGRVAMYSGATGKQLWVRDSSGDPFRIGRRLASGGDLTGDGVADVAVSANAYDTRVSEVWILSGKDGAIEARIPSPCGGVDGAIGALLVVPDLDADGRSDLLMGLAGRTRCTAFSSKTKKPLYEADILGARTDKSLEACEFTALARASRDHDGDGVVDFAAAYCLDARDSALRCSTAVAICSGRSGRKLVDTILGRGPRDEPCLSGGWDLDGDGMSEFLCSSEWRYVSVLRGNDLGALDKTWKTPAVFAPEGYGLTSCFAGDLDADGASEILLVRSDTELPSGELRLELHSGATGEMLSSVVARDDQPIVFEGADLDGDHVPELLVGIPENDELWIIDGRSAKTKDSRWWCQRVLTPTGSYVPKLEPK